LCLILCLFGAGRAARADTLRLDNNDLLRGEVLSGDEKSLKFKHATGSEMKISWDRVVYMQTDKAVELRTIDGAKLRGKLIYGYTPHYTVVVSESEGPVPVSLERIAALNEPEDVGVWTGRIALGLTVQDGNTRAVNFFFNFDAERRSKETRLEAHALYNYGENEHVLSTKKGFARAQFSWYFWNPVYAYVGGAAEYDRFQDLKLRARGGGGLGYAFIETKEYVARVEGGAEYVNEQFFDSSLNNAYVALRFAGHGEWQVVEALRLIEDLEYLPSTKDFQNFITRSTSSANLALWKGFGLAGIIVWQHVEEPQGERTYPPGKAPPPPLPAPLRDDVTYILTLTYTF
jgi:putative salt-induced outer membrane protein YdiY